MTNDDAYNNTACPEGSIKENHIKIKITHIPSIIKLFLIIDHYYNNNTLTFSHSMHDLSHFFAGI